MSEKTAEEKLREELEGSLLGKSPLETGQKKNSARTSRRPGRARTDKKHDSGNVNVRQRAGSFMDDFERKVEQSLNTDMFRAPRASVPEKQRQSAKKPSDDTEKIIPSPEPEAPAEHKPEESAKDIQEYTEELPDIPIIDDNDYTEQPDEELPDIPVISADEVDDPDALELEEDFADIPVIDAEEIPKDDENDELEAFYEEPDDTEEFSPSADVVLNVGEDLPQIQPPEQPQDPEAQASPVAVTMPETTRTAEDKLMADIAEAMTGNPLTLDSPDNPEPYKIPENFFASLDAGGENGTQSAEDKLIANIAQAMSESPIDTAQSQMNQSFEDDLNPFDEMPLPEAVNRFDPDPEPAEEPEESFLPDFHEEHEDITPEIEEPEEQGEQEEPEETYSLLSDEQEEELNDPFTIPDLGDDEPEESLPSDLEELPVAEDDIPEPEEPEKPEKVVTAQDRLAQEIAAFQQRENEPEASTEIPEVPDNNANIDLEEVSPESSMPEENLLPEDNIDITEDDDDWDISSLGALSEAASIPDYEPEPEPETGDIPIRTARIDETEEDYKEKTMGIRDKLAKKKSGASSEVSASTKKSSSGGGILTALLLGLLLAVGVLTLLQLRTLNDRITSAMINMGTFDPMQAPDVPQTYEYAIDFILDPNITERMAARGREGWQVAGSRRTQDSTTGQYGYEFIFMRRSR